VDVNLFHTSDGGEIQYVNGQAVMSDGFEASVYLSLFGGNAEDSGGTETDRLEWWGNKGEPDETRHYRSRTQHLVESLPAIPANLRRIEDAVLADLKWMLDTGLAATVEASVTMPAPKRIDIEVQIVASDDRVFVFERELAWTGAVSP
jgi:phage gp46-like protein